MPDINQNDDKNIIHLDEKDKKNVLKGILLKLKNIPNNLKSKISTLSEKFSPILKNLESIKTIFKNKKILYPSIAGAVILLIVLIILIFILNKEEPLNAIYQPKPTITPPANVSSTNIYQTDKQELQNLIEKASLLYNNGQIAEALDIYNNISIFSQSFASFNLGVAKLNNKDYKDSIDIFTSTINSGENISAAAINAAVASYNLGNAKSYDYYVNLAKGTMIEWYNKPLYSYLYSLINYYSNNYFNTFSSLKNPNSTFYASENNQLLTRMYIAFNDDYNALLTLLNRQDNANQYTIGLLYARMGEYDMAYKSIDSYLRDTSRDNIEAQMALGLIELKRANYTQASRIYTNLLEKNDMNDLNNIYPIKIKLKDSLFDINLFQKTFWNRTQGQNNTIYYKILFYFAPFRVFNINDTISIIREGGLELKMNNIEEANNVLLRSVMLSRINENITQGLKELLRYNVNNALEIIKQAALAYPNHQVLQYNLGLLYAQSNDFENARKHFLKAYHLDDNDILSGIFAFICAKLSNADSERILNEITNNFENIEFENTTQEGFYRSLFGFVNGNVVDDMLWFEQIKNNKNIITPMMSALHALYSINYRDKEVIRAAFNDLVNMSNNDMVALILSHIVNYYNEDIKTFSLNLFDFFKNDLKNLDLVYTGPSLAREIYIYMAFLVGANNYVDKILTDKLLSANDEIVGILQALALNSIYLLEFEKSFVYYNTLIDDYKINTSDNYFLAAVAAIGAGHYDNAVALIQLSRMETSSNLEARYALGLLHQTMGNLELARLQFMQMTNDGFKSSYFDFEIDTSEILKDYE